MQIEHTMAFAAEPQSPGLEVRINFGIFAGRDATAAEIDELGRLLVPHLTPEVSLVAEQRREIGVEHEVALHQVRIEVPSDSLPADTTARKALLDQLVGTAEVWARSCIAERHAEITEL